MKAKEHPLCFIILTILVASCLPTPPTKSQELLTDTPQAVTITATATRFLTATPTPTPIPTSTPLPSIIPGHWAEKEDGSFDARKMYPLVGAIDMKHHNVVDLSYNGVQVAVVTGEDVSQKDASSYTDFKNQHAAEINNNLDLKFQLDQLKSLIDQNNLDKYAVVVENGAIKWIVDQTGDTITFHKLENGQLTKEQEPRLLPKLKIVGKDIVRTDTDEPVVLRGVDLHNPLAPNYGRNLEDTSKLLKIAKLWGINFVRLQTTTSYVSENQATINILLREAERLGIYVMFSFSSKYGSYADIPIPDEEAIKDIVKLAKIIKPYSNSLIHLWYEPTWGDGGEAVSPEWTVLWHELTPFVEDIIPRIRAVNNDVIIGVPGIDWSTDHTYWASNPLEFNNVIYMVNDNPPWWASDKNDEKKTNDDSVSMIGPNDRWNGLYEKGLPILIQEVSTGSANRDEYNILMRRLKKKIIFYNSNKISYTIHQMSGWGWETPDVYNDMFDPNGKLIDGAGSYPISLLGENTYTAFNSNPGDQFDK